MELRINQSDVFLSRRPKLGGPKDCVGAILETDEAVKAVMEALGKVGFDTTAEELLILHGEEGAGLMDVRGERHGFLSKLVRTAQLVSNQLDTTQEIEKELLAGRYGILVPGATREERLQIKEILEKYKATHIILYGKLGPGSGAW